MPIIDGIIEGNLQFNTDKKAGIDVSLVKGAFYAVTDLTELNNININRISNNQIVWVQSESANYQATITLANGFSTFVDAIEWAEFTGFGSTEPGGTTDPLSIGGLTVNPGNVGTTLTLATGSDGSSALTIEGKDGGNILLINSASLTPVMVNNKGLIVLDDYPYFPTVTEGSLLYKDGDFYVGTPDLDDSSNNLATNINFTADFTGGDFDNNGDPANTVEVGTGTAPAFDLTTFSGGFGQDYTFRTLGSIYSKKQITLLKFFLNSNAFPEESGAKVLVSKSSTFEGPHSPDIKFTFNLDASYNEILIDSSKFTVYYLYFIFTKPLITYSISNIRIIRISDF